MICADSVAEVATLAGNRVTQQAAVQLVFGSSSLTLMSDESL